MTLALIIPPQLHELSLVIGAAFGVALIFCIWFIRGEIKRAINPRRLPVRYTTRTCTSRRIMRRVR